MMSNQFGKSTWLTALLAGFFCAALASSANAQFGNFNQIGGIQIDPSGELSQTTELMQREYRQQVLDSLANIDARARQSADLRFVSLSALEAALNDAANGVELPDEIKFMAGIQRIQYVIVQPENGDILLGGPGEGWTVDAQGNVVGETTGRPVIHLEDFIVALRTADAANREYGISVSIDPTQEGQQRLRDLFRREGFDPSMKQRIEDAMGPQTISLTGLPTDSRMAQVLVAADYHMKRLAMGFEQPAIDGLPSVLHMAEERGKGFNQDPRFWMEPSYDAIQRSEDGNVWHISGPGAKALTENEATNGRGKDHPIAVRWAENMTENFAALADADPVFAELQNIMDLAVVAAMIRKHDLLGAAHLQVPTIAGDNDRIAMPKWSVPQTVSTQCSFIQIRNSWMVTASGGVQVDSWAVLENVEINDAVASVVTRVGESGDQAWWNAIN